MLSSEQVAKYTQSKLIDVQLIWPKILQELKNFNLLDRSFVTAIAATIGCENHFRCIREIGPVSYFNRYIGILGNKNAEMAYKYRGAGLIQLTGYDNYLKYGKLIGEDLINNPEKANEIPIAIRILIIYFKDHGIDVWAKRGDWLKVRELVNGRKRRLTDLSPLKKPNGWERFSDYVWLLLEEIYKQ